MQNVQTTQLLRHKIKLALDHHNYVSSQCNVMVHASTPRSYRQQRYVSNYSISLFQHKNNEMYMVCNKYHLFHIDAYVYITLCRKSEISAVSQWKQQPISAVVGSPASSAVAAMEDIKVVMVGDGVGKHAVISLLVPDQWHFRTFI